MDTIIRETGGGIATAPHMGFNPIFLGSAVAYTDLIYKLGKGAMETIKISNDISGSPGQSRNAPVPTAKRALGGYQLLRFT